MKAEAFIAEHLEQLKNVHDSEERQATCIGLALIKLFNLQVKENGRVDTATHGDKTPLGLGRTVRAMVEEFNYS